MQKMPSTAATRTEPKIASPNVKNKLLDKFMAINAAVQPPTPKKAACPNDTRPVYPTRMFNPKANIAAIDYDPGASDVNQLNRIKLMMATAHKNMLEKE